MNVLFSLPICAKGYERDKETDKDTERPERCMSNPYIPHCHLAKLFGCELLSIG